LAKLGKNHDIRLHKSKICKILYHSGLSSLVSFPNATTSPNSGLAKGGFPCFAGAFMACQTSLLRMIIGDKNPALRQAADVGGKCKKRQ
jgi:hypothetical protein